MAGDNQRPPLLQALGVTKRFGKEEVLKGIDFDVHKGEVFCLIGPSGSGKSTVLRCINHLEKMDAGRILLDGELIGYRDGGDRLFELSERAVCAQRRQIGMVFQRFNLFAHQTALQNVMEAPTHVLGESAAAARERAAALLAQVGLAHKADAYPAQLSGGQQQRVAIARALAMQPKLMLFDEPTSALDPELVDEVLGVMRALAAAGTTMIVVTHEMAFARDVANRVAFMDGGEIVESGAPGEMLERPQHERTRSFLSRIITPQQAH